MLAATPNIWSLGPIKKIRHLAQWTGTPEGETVVEVLARYYREPSEQRGFGAVYNYISDRLPHRFERIPEDARDVFASGRGGHHMNTAMTYVVDAQVALVGWIEAWNEREEKRSASGKVRTD